MMAFLKISRRFFILCILLGQQKAESESVHRTSTDQQSFCLVFYNHHVAGCNQKTEQIQASLAQHERNDSKNIPSLWMEDDLRPELTIC
jgi:hypothetical protein